MTVNDRNSAGSPGAEERDARLDRLYRETERDSPPAHVDAAIRAAARREVGARPRAPAAALRRWRVPVSIAALVVLSVTLVTLVREEGGDDRAQVAPRLAPAPKPAAGAPRPAQPDAAEAPLGAMEARRAPAPPAPREERRVVAEPAAKQASPPSAPATEQVPMRAPAIAARRSAPAAGAGAPAADAESARALSGPLPSAASRRDPAPPWLGYEKEPPQKWLDRIFELRRQGENAAAGEMLAEFKRRFPDHPAPPGLDRH